MFKIPEGSSNSFLVRNTLYNFIGQFLPMIVALFSIPLLLKGLGVDRFGVLTLAWLMIGYFSLFDIGLGRALTKLVAEKRGSGQEQGMLSSIWTALILMLLLGIAGALAMTALTPWLVRAVLNIPEPLQHETVHSFYVLASSLPFVISTAGLRGVLEAYQQFGLVNGVRIFMGIYTFLGPLAVLQFSNDLGLVVAVLAAGRLLAWGAHLFLTLRAVPLLRTNISYDRREIGPLVNSGGWMTVSNIVGPLMNNIDRFMIGGLLAVTAVAYYATPYELITRLFIIPGALMGVLFPTFAFTFTQDRERVARLYIRGVKYLFLVMFPVSILVIIFAREGLTLWLGETFAANGTRVLQWLAIGVFVNSLSQMPFTLLQSAGYADFTGKLHLLELPFSLVIIWWFITLYGIEGAAIAWTVRLVSEAVILFIVARKLIPFDKPLLLKTLLASALSAFAITGAMWLQNPLFKYLFSVTIIIAFLSAAWKIVLAPHEKEKFLSLIR